MVLAVTVMAGCTWTAVVVPGPDWARWVLAAGIALTVAAGSVLAVLIGPAARRLSRRSTPPGTR
ncbi:hypothetical protein [Spongiactinospora sp. TRM90649]|uniref:hypothetical protein n=1 Tax=Spongiactinospora sp. TRM90649 TaxID=3031114 RepID=UPI0023F9DE05|nr:hypothetical protein [Spongiactinospora sp. TRM90649]MDF5753930.1 hypothetical protein [Spongiactinospora sp. TRM90649]